MKKYELKCKKSTICTQAKKFNILTKVNVPELNF